MSSYISLACLPNLVGCLGHPRLNKYQTQKLKKYLKKRRLGLAVAGESLGMLLLPLALFLRSLDL